MTKIKTNAKVTDGKLILLDRRIFIENIKQLEDCDGVLTFEKRHRNRTNPENRYYWGVIVKCWQSLITEEWGYLWDADKMHEFLKDNFNFVEHFSEQSGMIFKETLSTATLTTVEFETFAERCRRGAFENFNSIIPLPNEDLILDL